jgi:hypothetical protein
MNRGVKSKIKKIRLNATKANSNLVFFNFRKEITKLKKNAGMNTAPT